MNSFIPDSISSEDLENILSQNQWETDFATQIQECADKHLDAMLEEISDPLVHKVAALMIIKRLIDWHEIVIEKELEKQRYSNAIAWVGDKASLKHSFDALLNVEVGDEDFTTAD